MSSDILTLDELEALLAMATPGPWTADRWNVLAPDEDVDGEPVPVRVLETVRQDGRDAALIAGMRNALPELIRMARERLVLLTMKDGVCRCGCHDPRNRMRHIIACCFRCPRCGKGIARGYDAVHERECPPEPVTP